MRPTEQMMRPGASRDTAAQVAMAQTRSDPVARALLEVTHAHMYAWPSCFPGYRVALQVNFVCVFIQRVNLLQDKFIAFQGLTHMISLFP
jgi:hypothetical protein